MRPGGSRPVRSPRRSSSIYDETWIDYRVLWLNKDNLAVHFGYTDDSTRGHTDALKPSSRSATLPLETEEYFYPLAEDPVAGPPSCCTVCVT
ncbi:MAG: hypothetical protein DLM62_00985 [Pseudonocardiales bacterium]|nr:MAG: hypothetical protein DLM62_00985 [Pseudonocardiales bacterium]